MYTWEFVHRPIDPVNYGRAPLNANKCNILHRNVRIGEAVDSFWAQKIVDALNKADAS